MINDLISDMLTCLRNASKVFHTFTIIKYSNINLSILKILKDEGFIQNYILITDKSSLVIKVILKYKGKWIKKSFLTLLQRISKPGKRVYSKYKQFDKTFISLKYNQGILIISTSLGIMSHLKAKQLKKGGEILCYIE